MGVFLIEPLSKDVEFKNFTNSLYEFISFKNSLKFLSYSLKGFSKETVEELTRNHKSARIDYLVYKTKDTIKGILAYKKDFNGFELFLLVTDPISRKKGIGEKLIKRCIKLAKDDKFKCVSTFVFADNKNMLRLLLKNDFIPVDIMHHSRADGADLVKLNYYLK